MKTTSEHILQLFCLRFGGRTTYKTNYSPRLLKLQITLDVEARKENNHGNHVKNHQDIHPMRILTVSPNYNISLEVHTLRDRQHSHR